jgi:hypothetical protein
VKSETLDAVAFSLKFDEEGVVLSHGGVGHCREELVGSVGDR